MERRTGRYKRRAQNDRARLCDLRKALLKFITDFVNWDNAARRTYLEVSRELVKAAHGEAPPLVVDPFAGAARSRWRRYGSGARRLRAT
jgi:hypothetical protein